MPVFVDTNVLVYARDGSEPAKQPQATAWLQFLWETREGRTSQQVLHEYYVTVTQKLSPGLTAGEARDEIRDLLAWRPVVLDAALLERAWFDQDQYTISFWDALVVAAARAAGCDRLLTEDLQDGQDLGGVVVVDPFLHAPEER